MVIANPKNALRACESLLCNIIELLVDVEGQARDSGLTIVETQARGLNQATNDVLADIRSHISRIAQQ